MRLDLHPVSNNTRGIYDGKMPARFLYLQAAAAASFDDLEAKVDGLVYSDMFRSPLESLHALQTKRGVQPPGYSGHNFGFSVDVAVDETLKRHAWQYADLLIYMASEGWYCHRRDGQRGPEDWHFNFFGSAVGRYLSCAHASNPHTWSAPLEAKIQDCYGAVMRLDVESVQALLQQLKLYSGEIDGVEGPLTVQALNAFQRAWLLPVAPHADIRCQRTLSIVTV